MAGRNPGDQKDVVWVTPSCNCRVRMFLKPMGTKARYACRSNQGHSYHQPWVSYTHRGAEIRNRDLVD